MDLITFLESKDASEVVEKVIQSILNEGGVTVGIAESQPNKLIIELALGTMKARKLGKGLTGFLFTQQMAEQSTHPLIAQYHAQSLANALPNSTLSLTGQHVNMLTSWSLVSESLVKCSLVEVCTGAGVDTHALANVFEKLVSYEVDATVASIARGNMLRAGIKNVEIKSDSWPYSNNHTATLPHSNYQVHTSTSSAVWSDPSRRTTGKRLRRIESYQPPIESILNTNASCIGIKLGPADDIPSELLKHCNVEVIGFGKECREKILWKGASNVPAVTLVDKQVSWTPHETNNSVDMIQPLAGMILVEPHAAIIASGRVADYFSEIGAGVIDERIGYGVLTRSRGDEVARLRGDGVTRSHGDGVARSRGDATSLDERFEIIDIDSGVSVKRIQQRINALQWNSRTEFKKRGWDKTTDWLWHQLEFEETETAGVVVVSRIIDRHITLFCIRR